MQLTVLIDYEDKYYKAIANRYGWQAILPNEELNPISYEEFALNWLKQQIAIRILEPEFISFQNGRMEELHNQIYQEAKDIISSGIL